MIRFKLDTRRFQTVARETARSLERQLPAQVLAPAAERGVEVAKQHTPQAKESQIRDDLTRNAVKYKLVSRPGKSRAQVAEDAENLLRRRLRAIGYIRKGWRVLLKHGGIFFGNVSRGARKVARLAFRAGKRAAVAEIERRGPKLIEKTWRRKQ